MSHGLFFFGLQFDRTLSLSSPSITHSLSLSGLIDIALFKNIRQRQLGITKGLFRSICPALLCSGKRRGERTYDQYLLEENNNHDNQKRTKKNKGFIQHTLGVFAVFMSRLFIYSNSNNYDDGTYFAVNVNEIKDDSYNQKRRDRSVNFARNKKKTINRNYPLSLRQRPPLLLYPTTYLFDISH